MTGEIKQVQMEVGGLRFDALAAGPTDGRLVLLLHGWPQTSRAWEGLLPRLAGAGYFAVAPDQRGYSPGARPAGVEHYTMTHLVADTLGMIEGLGADQADVVGHDWGGAVAWCVAALAPTRTRSLTVASTPHPLALSAALADPASDQGGRSAYMAFFREGEGKAEAALLDDGAKGLRNVYASTGLGPVDTDYYVATLGQAEVMTPALAWYRAMSPAGFAGTGGITVPTLYVWGSDDPALGRQAAEATASYVDGPYRFVELEGVGHWVPELATEAFGDLLMEHLAST